MNSSYDILEHPWASETTELKGNFNYNGWSLPALSLFAWYFFVMYISRNALSWLLWMKMKRELKNHMLALLNTHTLFTYKCVCVFRSNYTKGGVASRGGGESNYHNRSYLLFIVCLTSFVMYISRNALSWLLWMKIKRELKNLKLACFAQHTHTHTVYTWICLYVQVQRTPTGLGNYCQGVLATCEVLYTIVHATRAFASRF